MQLLLLVPFLISFYFIWRGSARSAFLNVFLPVLLLIPGSYVWRIPHLPPVNYMVMTLLPIAAALPFYLRWWQPRRIDLWVALFTVCFGISESRNTSLATGSIIFFDTCVSVVIPYLCGRLLIEQWMMRMAVLKRIVLLISIAGVIGLSEFPLKVNIFRKITQKLFSGTTEVVGWTTQERWGFGRVSGPYGHAILAGVVFGMALVILVYLRRTEPWWQRRMIANFFPVRMRTALMVALVVALFCTISRGPWIGAIVSLVIALLGTRRYLDKKSVWVLILLVVAGYALKTYIAYASSGQYDLTQDNPNQTAQYRAQLWTVYAPIVRAGGLWGFGVTAFPRVGGFDSIDNEYLSVLVTQGYIGLTLFVLMLLESLLTLYKSLSTMTTYEDRFFTFTLGGILLGLMLTMATVFIDEQPKPLLFMLFGWIQALRPASVPSPAMIQAAQPRFSFRRVWT